MNKLFFKRKKGYMVKFSKIVCGNGGEQHPGYKYFDIFSALKSMIEWFAELGNTIRDNEKHTNIDFVGFFCFFPSVILIILYENLLDTGDFSYPLVIEKHK